MNCDITKLETEQRNPGTMNLDEMSSTQIATIMNIEDIKVVAAVRKEIPNISKAIDLCAKVYQQGGRIIYMGAGSSGRYAVVDAVECPPTFGVSKDTFTALLAGGHQAIWDSVEGAEDSKEMADKDIQEAKLTSKDVIVGLAASGRTPYVIEGLKVAKKMGLKIITISCNTNDLISKYADISIHVVPGPEVLTGSTRLKCGTAEKLVLNMISTGTMVRSGKVYENLMVDVVQSNEKLKERTENIIMAATNCSEEEASKKLQEAKGECKPAIVSILLNCSIAEANDRLKKSKGFIRKAIKK
jgi:N-acetylmuramic acid 6-phosphate etherase